MRPNELTLEDVEALRQDKLPVEGEIPPLGVRFRCDVCYKHGSDREADEFALFPELRVIEGRCRNHAHNTRFRVSYSVGARYLWSKILLAEVLRA